MSYTPEVYIPMDRRQAMARNQDVAQRAEGAALFADISGFTPITEALAKQLGARRGAEELTRLLNSIYGALIAELERYHGSVIGFSGDAITCWLDEDDGLRAAACALAMQETMRRFSIVTTPSGAVFHLAIKVAIAAGQVRRFQVGNPEIQYIDVLAGATLDRLASAEHQANRGEIVLSAEVVKNNPAGYQVVEWRTDHETGEQCALISGVLTVVDDFPWPDLPEGALTEEQIRPWIIPAIYELVKTRQDIFQAELRPAVALFLRFGGIDYDQDEGAGEKLDAYIRWVQGIVARYDGALIQLTIGDKGSYLYIAFGAPIAHEDDVARAAMVALQLRSTPEDLRYIQQVQVGISKGRMRVGPYGGPTRRTYGSLGDHTNLAARLMQNAFPGEVLVSLDAQKEVATEFEWASCPPLQVKGKAEPVSVFRLAGKKTQQELHLQEPRYSLPMVGRQMELAVIEEKLAGISAAPDRQPRGLIIAITADAGLGKSRLVAEVIRRAQARQMTVFAGECQSYGTNTNYLVWRSIWQAFFGTSPEISAGEQLTGEQLRSLLIELEARLSEANPELVPRLPLLGMVLNLPIPNNELTQSMDARLRKESLEALLVDCLRARTRRTKIMLVLEDCHWIDPLSHDLLEAIGRAIFDLPVVIMMAYRPPQLERLQSPRITNLPHTTVIPLSDFNSEETKQLILLKLAQFGVEEALISERFIQLLTDRAQGNPFYIEELINYLHDRGLSAQDLKSITQIDLPSSLHSLILSRIDQLSESQKITLKIASVIGRLFRRSWLWGVDAEIGDLDQVLEDLQMLNSLDLTPLDQPEPEETYLFKHIITREVAYESLPFATRALLHGNLGEFIEKVYREALERYVDLLAYHYDLSQNAGKKLEYLRKAGEAAQAAFANQAAIDYYRRLLPLVLGDEQIDILLKLGGVLELVGEWDEAYSLYGQALVQAEEAGNHPAMAQAHAAMGQLLGRRGEYVPAETALNQARDAFEEIGDRAGASHVLTALGEIARRKGEYDTASDYYTRSLQLAERAKPARVSMGLRAMALKGAGSLAIHHGDYETARIRYNKSLGLLRRLGDKPVMSSVLGNLGIVARLTGEMETAQELQEQSLRIGRELGDLWGMASSLGNLGMIANGQQDFRRAEALYKECLALYRQLGEKSFTALALNNLGDVALEQGRVEEARRLYQEALSIQSELGDGWAIAYLLEAFSSLAARLEQPARAIRLAGAAHALRAQINAPLSDNEQDSLNRKLENARHALGEEMTEQASAEGRAMLMKQAIDYALAA